jgi:hypothetical protein
VKLGDRPTADLIVILFAVGVVALIILIELSAVIITLIHPDIDLTGVFTSLSEHVGTLIAVIVGYLGGRGASVGLDRVRGKDENDTQEPPMS